MDSWTRIHEMMDMMYVPESLYVAVVKGNYEI